MPDPVGALVLTGERVTRVLIDLRMVRGRLHGIARYALELARRLPSLQPSWEFAGLTAPGGIPDGLGDLKPQIPLVACPAGFLSPWEQPALLASLSRASCDLFHATSFSVPALWPGRLVVTLHDAIHLALPENHSWQRLAYYRLLVGPRARFAAALIAPSEFSRAELSKHLGLNAYRFQVIHQGVGAAFHSPTEEEARGWRNARRLPARYLAAVGNPKPHKNLSLLARLASSLPLPIVLAAGSGAKAELGFPDSTIELPTLSEAEMPLLYGAAVAMLHPSRYEGFGLPVLEAMQCGTVVITSRDPAIVEVAAGSAIHVDAEDTTALVGAMSAVAREPQRFGNLKERALARSRDFTWQRTARRTREIYGDAWRAFGKG